MFYDDGREAARAAASLHSDPSPRRRLISYDGFTVEFVDESGAEAGLAKMKEVNLTVESFWMQEREDLIEEVLIGVDGDAHRGLRKSLEGVLGKDTVKHVFLELVDVENVGYLP